MRCRVGAKKLRRWRRQTGWDIRKADVRGGSGHFVRLFIAEGDTGRVRYWNPRTGEMEDDTIRWTPQFASFEEAERHRQKEKADT